jgi:hypothetical protein
VSFSSDRAQSHPTIARFPASVRGILQETAAVAAASSSRLDEDANARGTLLALMTNGHAAGRSLL